jgi:hypothetical protein
VTDGVRPIGPVEGRDRRAAQRREAERRAASTSRELVPVGKVVDEIPDPASPAVSAADTNPLDPAAAFAAQMMGQTGQRKGIKGGPPLMDAARASYLGAEYSGEKDRRPPAGLIKKTEL